MKKTWFVFFSSGQWIACLVLIAGLSVELVQHAHVGYILITAGSFAFAIITKFRYYMTRS